MNTDGSYEEGRWWFDFSIDWLEVKKKIHLKKNVISKTDMSSLGSNAGFRFLDPPAADHMEESHFQHGRFCRWDQCENSSLRLGFIDDVICLFFRGIWRKTHATYVSNPVLACGLRICACALLSSRESGLFYYYSCLYKRRYREKKTASSLNKIKRKSHLWLIFECNRGKTKFQDNRARWIKAIMFSWVCGTGQWWSTYNFTSEGKGGR